MDYGDYDSNHNITWGQMGKIVIYNVFEPKFGEQPMDKQKLDS